MNQKQNFRQQFGMFTDGLYKQPWKAGDDVINLLTSEDMRNTPFGSQM